MLRWFGHRAQCANRVLPSYRGEHALVCARCMPDFVPRCAMCTVAATALGVTDGFTHYGHWYLCASCVAKVQAVGPWKIRRAHANQARVDALQARFPGLHVAEAAPRRIAVAGEIDGRAASITLKIAAREGESERYVLRVALRSARTTIARDELAIDASLIALLVTGSPTITVDDHRWLRLGFRHLGKLDMVHALEGMIDTATRLDAEVETPTGLLLRPAQRA